MARKPRVDVEGGLYHVITRVSTYASNFQYRAWGAVKHLDYGNNRTLDQSYNSRMQTSSFTISGLINKTYQYHADAKLGYSHDLIDQRFDRGYVYDHGGRMQQALSGAEARGEPPTNDRPYKQTLTYDAFDHLTSRDKHHWSGTGGVELPANNSYLNNRNTVWSYDAAGNLLQTGQIPTISYQYDAAGRMSRSITDNVDLTQSFDGDGRTVKRYEVDTIYEEGVPPRTETATLYQLRSTVMGGSVLTEVGAQGQKARTYVYANGTLLGWQQVVYVNGAPTAEQIVWEHRDPSNATYRTSQQTFADSESWAELDPFGSNAGLENPYPTNPPPQNHKPNIFYPGLALSADSMCNLDGIPTNCALTINMMNAGSAELCPNNYCGPDVVKNPWTGEDELRPLTRDPETGVLGHYPTSFEETVGGLLPKTVKPKNPFARFASDRKLSDEECDEKLSSIFGGFAKAMVNSDVAVPSGRGAYGHSAVPRNDMSANRYDPEKKAWVRRADRGGIIHTYTDSVGSARTDVPLTTPAGWHGKPKPYNVGGNSGLIFTYSGGITIEFVHVGTANLNGVPSIPVNRPDKRGLVQIGYVGGEGGEGAYLHTHIVFFSNKGSNERLDPRVLFCGFPK